jgi:hypothetical protein
LKETVTLSGWFQADGTELGGDVLGSTAGTSGAYLAALKAIVCEVADVRYGIGTGLWDGTSCLLGVDRNYC